MKNEQSARLFGLSGKSFLHCLKGFDARPPEARAGLHTCSTTSRSQCRDRVIWRRVANEAHSEEDCQEIEPNCKIRHPAVGSERPDLIHEEAGENEDQRADDVTDLELGHHIYVLSELDRDLTQNQE